MCAPTLWKSEFMYPFYVNNSESNLLLQFDRKRSEDEDKSSTEKYSEWWCANLTINSHESFFYRVGEKLDNLSENSRRHRFWGAGSRGSSYSSTIFSFSLRTQAPFTRKISFFFTSIFSAFSSFLVANLLLLLRLHFKQTRGRKCFLVRSENQFTNRPRTEANFNFIEIRARRKTFIFLLLHHREK